MQLLKSDIICNFKGHDSGSHVVFFFVGGIFWGRLGCLLLTSWLHGDSLISSDSELEEFIQEPARLEDLVARWLV